MRILADVNVAKAIVMALRSVGHDVLWAVDQMATEPDFKILAAAQRQSRIVLTNDKDFGDIAIHAGLSADGGIILLRLKALSVEETVIRTMDAIQNRTDWKGHFAVIDRQRVRMRPLPPITSP